MRRWATSLLAAAAGLCASGCVMVIGVREPIELSDDKKVVIIDGEAYAVDLENNRIKKLNCHAVETTTTTTVETKPD